MRKQTTIVVIGSLRVMSTKLAQENFEWLTDWLDFVNSGDCAIKKYTYEPIF